MSVKLWVNVTSSQFLKKNLFYCTIELKKKQYAESEKLTWINMKLLNIKFVLYAWKNIYSCFYHYWVQNFILIMDINMLYHTGFAWWTNKWILILHLDVKFSQKM